MPSPNDAVSANSEHLYDAAGNPLVVIEGELVRVDGKPLAAPDPKVMADLAKALGLDK